MISPQDYPMALVVLESGGIVSDDMVDSLRNVGLVSTDGGIVQLTPAGYRVLGSPGERVHRTPREIALANYRAAADAAWAAYREGVRYDGSNLFGLRIAAYDAERNLAELEKTT